MSVQGLLISEQPASYYVKHTTTALHETTAKLLAAFMRALLTRPNTDNRARFLLCQLSLLFSCLLLVIVATRVGQFTVM